jgi:hypothetical protein
MITVGPWMACGGRHADALPLSLELCFPNNPLTGQNSGPLRSTSPVMSLVGGARGTTSSFRHQKLLQTLRSHPAAGVCSSSPAHPLHRSPEISSSWGGGFPRLFPLLGSCLVTKQGKARTVQSHASPPKFSTLGVTSAASRSQLPVLITSTTTSAPAEAPGDGV